MARTVFPGSIDYNGSMSCNFDVGRGLSADARAVWHAALHPHLADAHRILDVGSGTGRFAVLLAEWFGAVVVGVEPAAGMRHVAATTARHPAVFYVGGRAEQLPIREASFTAALLSNVYHHIPNRSACALELCRVLRPGGRVLIRGAFAGRLGEITLFDHFPEAKVVCEQFPSMEEAVDTFTGSGFILESVERVVQRTCSSLKELTARTRLRADTTLALMTDDAFNARQAALEQAAAAETEPTPVVDTLDLITMRKAAA
jgi:ubiquinone/menaquinone biosynthesis C-methylase UbiE